MVKILLLVLQLIAANLFYTDQMQTKYWSGGTVHAPVQLAAEVTAYELNPILAGHPERVKPYFTILKAAVLAAPFVLSTDRALLYLTGTVIAEGIAVWHNNRILQMADIPGVFDQPLP